MQRLSPALCVGIIILILCFSYIFISCGKKGPLTKALTGIGAYAVDLPTLNPLFQYISAPISNAELLNSPVTVEAWIKIDDLVNGGGSVFARGDIGYGIELYVLNADGFPRFGAADNDESPTSRIAIGTTNVMDGTWHHLAGVLTVGGHDHSGPSNPGTTCDAGAQGGRHVDIYVDGDWENCAGPFVYPESAGTDASIDSCQDVASGDYVDCSNNIGRDITAVITGVLFTGIIDEVRLWKEARDKSVDVFNPGQNFIQTWRLEEITVENWNDANPNYTLAGYWKFNEGTGSIAIDSSGYGNSATKFQCTGGTCGGADEEFGPWNGGWVPGYPF